MNGQRPICIDSSEVRSGETEKFLDRNLCEFWDAGADFGWKNGDRWGASGHRAVPADGYPLAVSLFCAVHSADKLPAWQLFGGSAAFGAAVRNAGGSGIPADSGVSGRVSRGGAERRRRIPQRAADKTGGGTAAFFLQQRGACVPVRHGGGHVPPPVDGVGAVGHPHRGRVVCGAADSGETRRPRQADEDKSPLPRFRPEHRNYGHGNGMRLGGAFPGSAGISETVDFLDSPSGSTGRGHGDSGAFQRLL